MADSEMPVIDLQFDPAGLIPVVVQDAASGQVLMLAHMNRDALGQTLRSGDVWYWSRSRRQLWRKGEQSGHTQRIRAIHVDCDGDALLLQVEQTGAACHTGRASCFYRAADGREIDMTAPVGIFDVLFALLQRRREDMPGGSYSASLFRAGPAAIAEKVIEESAEVVRAARGEGPERVVEETADLLYHLWVLLVDRGVHLADVRREMERRRGG